MYVNCVNNINVIYVCCTKINQLSSLNFELDPKLLPIYIIWISYMGYEGMRNEIRVKSIIWKKELNKQYNVDHKYEFITY